MPMEKTYSQSPFTGQIHCPAPVTPFSPEGELLLEDFAQVLRYHLNVVGVDTMLIAGCNGEGYALDDDELGQVTATAARTVEGRIPFYVHVTRTPTRECIRRAEIAAQNGAYGIALGQPQIYDSSPEVVRDRFARVAKAVPLPMMVYNLSHLSHYGFSPEDMRALCDVAPRGGDQGRAHGLRPHQAHLGRGGRPACRFCTATRTPWCPPCSWGGGGFVGTGPEIFGRDCRRLFFGVHEMSPQERMDLHCRYGMVSDALMWSVGLPPAGIKAAMKMIGVSRRRTPRAREAADGRGVEPPAVDPGRGRGAGSRSGQDRLRIAGSRPSNAITAGAFEAGGRDELTPIPRTAVSRRCRRALAVVLLSHPWSEDGQSRRWEPV